MVNTKDFHYLDYIFLQWEDIENKKAFIDSLTSLQCKELRTRLHEIITIIGETLKEDKESLKQEYLEIVEYLDSKLRDDGICDEVLKEIGDVLDENSLKKAFADAIL